MATDTTELTFVRCPSCRSLVPAVSTRCRMCGATLDAGGDAAAAGSESRPPPSPQPSRVRQNTGMVTAEAAALVAGEPPPPSPAPPVREPVEMAAEPEIADEPVVDPLSDDPLGSYIQEVEVESSVVAADDEFEPEMEIPAPAPRKERPQNGKAHAAPPPEPETLDDEEPAPRRVVTETGKGNKRGGLSYGAPKETPAPTPPKESRPRADQSQPNRDSRPPRREDSREAQTENRRPERQQQQQQQARRDQQRPAAAGPRPDAGQQRGNQKARPPEQREQNARPNESDRRSERPPVPTAERREAPRPSGTRRENTTGNRLCGWLVSFGDPNGSALTLREGKFFITGSPLKEHDLVLDDPSVSTPHAMVSVHQDGIDVQDLMSDRGLFVRSGGAYNRVDERVTLQHGDWIRIGDVEFLVAVVPTSGER